jgi:hypothetical protein
MAMLHWAQPTVALRPAQLRFSCSIWPFSPRARAGESAGFRRAAMADQISAAADDEVQWGGFVEQAGRVANQIWGGGEEGGVIGGACSWRGKNVGMTEWRSPMGSEWSERNSLAARSSGWGQGGPRMTRGGWHWRGPRGAVGGGGRTVVSGVAAVVARRGARKRGVALAPTLK